MVSVLSMFVALTIISINLKIFQATSNVTLHEQTIFGYHQKWMIQFSRVYKDDFEKEMRFKVFKKNLIFIENFNNMGNQSYELGVNEFTDMTKEEFRATYTGGLRGINVTSLPEAVDPTMWLPSSYNKDWRAEGAVTPVKNQGNCAVAAVEALTKISRKRLVSLSEQQLVDCVGGLIKGYERVPSNSEIALLNSVGRQPVSVSIDTSSDGFMHYRKGVFDAKDCGVGADHAVTLVGYGTTEEGVRYWLAKNSWGGYWGEKGYMRIRRSVDWPQGMCGVARYPFYPVV
ncbi:hypothetical protein N665_0720s0003 [Sinapis alba]|nr:hypothetical protein N665_0720s0003 [Sinapis alba]